MYISAHKYIHVALTQVRVINFIPWLEILSRKILRLKILLNICHLLALTKRYPQVHKKHKRYISNNYFESDSLNSDWCSHSRCSDTH